MSVSPRRTVICSVNQARCDSAALSRRACPADSASRDRPRGSAASKVGSLAVLRASASRASITTERAVKCASLGSAGATLGALSGACAAPSSDG